jgi:hypothetical protein
MGRQLRNAARAVTTAHWNLTSSWIADVETMERAVERFTVNERIATDCHVAFFEIAGDGELHVNVTHQHPTPVVRGWAGPARLPNGFVHNRRFAHAPPSRIVRHIRNMVFAYETGTDSRAST